MPNISQSKCNQTMRFSHVIEYNNFKNEAEKEARRLVPDLFLFLKALYGVKASSLQLSINIFW